MEVAFFVIIAVVVIVFAVRLYGNFGRITPKEEYELLSLCGNGKNRLERLIVHEQQKRQILSREEAAKYAIDSMRRDNR